MRERELSPNPFTTMITSVTKPTIDKTKNHNASNTAGKPMKRLSKPRKKNSPSVCKTLMGKLAIISRNPKVITYYINPK